MSILRRLEAPGVLWDGAALITETSFALLENAVKAFRGYLRGKAEREEGQV